MESKVFWGVLCALLVFSGISWALFALGVFGARVAVSQAVEQAQAETDVRLRQISQQEAMRAAYERARQAAEESRHMLAADQQCVGGAVVQVHGTEYTQLGSIAQPVHCVGRRADRPLR